MDIIKTVATAVAMALVQPFKRLALMWFWKKGEEGRAKNSEDFKAKDQAVTKTGDTTDLEKEL